MKARSITQTLSESANKLREYAAELALKDSKASHECLELAGELATIQETMGLVSNLTDSLFPTSKPAR